MASPAPKQSMGKYILGFKTMTIPVSLYKGEDEAGVQRHQYTRDGRAVGRLMYVKDTEPPEIVKYDDVVSCVDTDKGLVALSPAELAEIDYGVDVKTMTIVCFLPLRAFGSKSYVPRSVGQIRLSKREGNRPPDKLTVGVFAALLKAMRNKGVFALVEYAPQNAPSYAALMATGRLYTLRFDDEVREDLPLPDLRDVDRDAVRQMELLIDTNTESEPPTLVDRVTPAIWDLVERKAANGDVIKAIAAAASPGHADLMETLRASVEQAKTERSSTGQAT